MKIMYGFGCSIIAYDPLENEELKEQIDIRYTTRRSLHKFRCISFIVH
jgi:D-lactate dehydrogenase